MNGTTIKGVTFLVHPRKRAPYLPAEGYRLRDVYRTYSNQKLEAYAYCHRIMNQVEGTGLAITSHNCQFFSVRFYFYDEQGRPMMAHITPYYNHAYYVHD